MEADKDAVNVDRAGAAQPLRLTIQKHICD